VASKGKGKGRKLLESHHLQKEKKKRRKGKKKRGGEKVTRCWRAGPVKKVPTRVCEIAKKEGEGEEEVCLATRIKFT